MPNKRPKDMTIDELESLQIGDERFEEIPITDEMRKEHGYLGSVLKRSIMEKGFAGAYKPDDIMGFIDKEGVPWALHIGGPASGSGWYRRRV